MISDGRRRGGGLPGTPLSRARHGWSSVAAHRCRRPRPLWDGGETGGSLLPPACRGGAGQSTRLPLVTWPSAPHPRATRAAQSGGRPQRHGGRGGKRIVSPSLRHGRCPFVPPSGEKLGIDVGGLSGGSIRLSSRLPLVLPPAGAGRRDRKPAQREPTGRPWQLPRLHILCNTCLRHVGGYRVHGPEHPSTSGL